MAEEKYIAQERVRHSVTRQYYEPGQVIPVDHLSPADLAALVERGVLRKVVAVEPPPVGSEEPARPARASRKIEEEADHA